MNSDNHSKTYLILGTLGIIGVICFIPYSHKVNNPEWESPNLYTQEEANREWQKELQEHRQNSKPRLESYTETYNNIIRQKELERLEPYIQAQIEISQNEIDAFQDQLDYFYDDMQDELRFPPEVFDANRD